MFFIPVIGADKRAHVTLPGKPARAKEKHAGRTANRCWWIGRRGATRCLTRCSASVENAGLGVELTHCCLRKEQWYEQTRTAALQCPRESQNPPAPFAGRQSG